MQPAGNRFDPDGLIAGMTGSLAVTEYRDGQWRLTAVNDRFLRLVGFAGDDAPLARPLTEVLPKPIAEEVTVRIQQALERGDASETERYNMPGTFRWWRLSVQPLGGEDGDPRPVLLVGVDLSERTRHEDDVRLIASRFGAVVNAAHDGILSIDEDQNIRMFNRAAEEIFGYKAAEVLGRPLTMLLPEGPREKHADYVAQFDRSADQSREMLQRGTVYGRRKDGSEFPTEITISKISVLGRREFTAAIRDVSERAALLEELRVKATTDPLTGLANRAVLMDRGASFLALAKRHNHPFSVLMLDIDHFKSVNDTYGHDVGDRVILALGRLLTDLARGTDIVARYGGEEFALVLPETGTTGAETASERIRASVEGAHELAERIRTSVAAGPEAGFNGPVPVTVSIGVAALSAPDDDLERILKRADEALYDAKRRGRNRVVIADHEQTDEVDAD